MGLKWGLKVTLVTHYIPLQKHFAHGPDIHQAGPTWNILFPMNGFLNSFTIFCYKWIIYI